MNPNREYITAISISQGLIQLVEPDGCIAIYRQRGIQTLSPFAINLEIKSGNLSANWNQCPELPKEWSISFEEPDIMGRALATYPLVLKIQNEKRKKSK